MSTQHELTLLHAAREHLLDGTCHTICSALHHSWITAPNPCAEPLLLRVAWFALKEEIESGLGDYAYFPSWLFAALGRVYPPDKAEHLACAYDLQGRLAWLDKLIDNRSTLCTSKT